MPDEIELLRKRVASSPENLEFRFALGAALMACRDHAGALMELQRAQASPKRRHDAMRLIADAFEARGMADLAARKRRELSDETGEDGDAGSAPIPMAPRPRTPPGTLSGAADVPRDEN